MKFVRIVIKIMCWTCWILIIGYLVGNAIYFGCKSDHRTCIGIHYEVTIASDSTLIPQKEIEHLLKKNKIYPVGKEMQTIYCQQMEDLLNKHPLVDNTECYKTRNSQINIEITPRIPIIKVMGNNGKQYFIDNKARILVNKNNCNNRTVIATGYIDEAYALHKLYPLANFIFNSPFWKAQIEQINVLPGQKIELVPRVGNHIIYLGDIENYEQKFARLKTFYTKVLNKIGWNKYSRINMEFDNQIIGTLRDYK